uniref:Uncharacterized protein n=1 Tax=Arundo donax TaxID=35708 RepID=A0A0A9F3N2_ARUDO
MLNSWYLLIMKYPCSSIHTDLCKHTFQTKIQISLPYTRKEIARTITK